MLKNTVFFILTCCRAFQLAAQPMLFEHINAKQGLSQNTIYTIAQDELGFLWFGTDDGLNRFDGYEFDVYRSDEKNKYSILPGKIIDINGNGGVIALLTEGGVSLFDVKTLISKNFLFSKIINKPHFILKLETSVFIGADNGLFELNTLIGEFKQTQITEPVTGFTIIKQGLITIAVTSGFYLYYPFNKKLVQLNYKPQFYVVSVTSDKQQKIHWVESNGTVFSAIIDGNELKILKYFELPENFISKKIIAYGKDLIIATSNGLVKINAAKEKFTYTYHENEPYSLSDKRILSLFEDYQHNLWIGTVSGGINKFHPYRFKFSCISPDISSRFKSITNILAFAEDESGNIIFSSADGYLGLFDLSQRAVLFLKETELIVNVIIPLKNNPNSFLLGTGKGLYIYDKKGIRILKTVKPFVMDVKTIVQADINKYWVAGNDGLFLFDFKQEAILDYFSVGNSRLGSNNIRSILLNKNNELFLATSAGLYTLNTASRKAQRVRLTGAIKEPFITQILKDKNGNIWIGTVNQGVFNITLNHKIEKYNTYNGLKNNNIYGILENQSQHEIWISTNAGISRFKMNQKHFDNYDIYDGLQGNEFNESAQLITKNGYFIFGGTNGFNFFKPNDVKNDEENCKVAIKKMLVFNKEEPYSSYYNFSYKKNYVTIEFVALDYNFSGNNKYYYFVEGLQNEWTEAGNRRFASFGELQAGNYVFKVKATNADGKLSNQIASVSFSIIPPFWQTWWFRIVLIVLLAGSVAFFIFYRVNSVIEEEQEKTKNNKMIAELELKALRAQMNPHFIFNSLNSIQDFVLNNEGALAAKYLSKFAKLMRMILDISEQTFVDIQLKVTFLKLYVELEALRMNNSFTYHFEIENNIDLDGQIPTLLIQPNIENAIWHGLQYKKGDKTLTIRMNKISEDILKCEVEDNGIGRQAAMLIKQNKTVLYQSKGTKISDERIKILKKTFGKIITINNFKKSS